MFGWGAKKTFGKSDDAGSGEGKRRRVGLALGSGAARGFAQIGVLREFLARGLEVDLIAGCSIGAVVGGCFAAQKLDALEHFARGLTRRKVFSLLDFTLSGAGLISGARLKTMLDDALGGQMIETLPKNFAAVATEIGAGHEVWLRRGDLSCAIRASYAVPGIFAPICVDGRWLFDGALVNPVPVTLCRAMGADVVIAVTLIGEAAFHGALIAGETPREPAACPIESPAPESRWLDSGWLSRPFKKEAGAPGAAAAMLDAFNISQDRIARARLAGDPPDMTIAVRLPDIGLFDFHRADEIISRGRAAAQRALDEFFPPSAA